MLIEKLQSVNLEFDKGDRYCNETVFPRNDKIYIWNTACGFTAFLTCWDFSLSECLAVYGSLIYSYVFRGIHHDDKKSQTTRKTT